MLSLKHSVIAAMSAVLLIACASQPQPTVQSSAAEAAPAALSEEQFAKSYRLGAGDRLRVTVYGEDDLSGDYLVGSEGSVSLPLIGQVGAGQRTVEEFERAVTASLQEGFIKEPRVSVEILNYRPFYIHGEVENGGEYPYQAGMSVLNAIAVAGGYTYRANERRVFITREGTADEARYPATQGTQVRPGDVIRVPERFF